MYFCTFFFSPSVCACDSSVFLQKEEKLKAEVMLCGRKMTSTVFSKTSQGNQGAHTPLYITTPFAIGHNGELFHHYPSSSTVTTGSLKCHPQGPKDDCWDVIGSARQAGCYGEARFSKG